MKFAFRALVAILLTNSLFLPHAHAGNSINFTAMVTYKYRFLETAKFPATLKKNQVNFSQQINSDCVHTGTLHYVDEYASVVLSSGRQLDRVLLKSSAKISSFMWSKNDAGESELKVTMVCTRTGKLPVVSSNSYAVAYGPTYSSYYPISPDYSPSSLSSNGWKVKLEIAEKFDYSTGEGLQWTPVQ